MATLNINKQMRSNAKLGKIQFNLSKGAILEMKDRLEMFFECRMSDLCLIAQRHKRKTIYDTDVIELFGMVKNQIAPEDE